MIVFTVYFIFEGFYCDIFNEHFENCFSYEELPDSTA